MEEVIIKLKIIFGQMEYILDIPENKKVSDLNELFQNKANIDDDLIFRFNGRSLRFNSTLKESGLKNNSIIICMSYNEAY